MDRGKLPTVDQPCPKCGNCKAHGPEYRRGVGTDEGLGEHLRFYCTVCRYMTAEPTQDQDTPERRVQLTAAFVERKSRPRPTHADYPPPSRFDQHNDRDREIESVRKAAIGGRHGRGQGWK